MSDCVRFSDIEIEGKESWYVSPDKWISRPDIRKSGASECRKACVSEPGCKLWRYKHEGGECFLSFQHPEDASMTEDYYSSGRVRCAPEYDLLKVAIYSLILTFIFVLWWYLTRPCSN